MAEPPFFFGAGASRPFGIPTMKEMVGQFRDELANVRSDGINDEIRFYDGVKTSLESEFGRVGLESVFTVIDAVAQGKTLKEIGYFAAYMAKERGGSSLLDPPSNESRQTAQRLRARFEGYVKRVCWVKPDKLGQILKIYLAFFHEIRQAVGGGPISQFQVGGNYYYYNAGWNFFTTNYDNVLELLWRSGIMRKTLNTGFAYDPVSKSEIWNPQLILQQNLKLTKLHGSVTWWREEDTGRIVEKDQPPDSAYIPRKFGEQIILYPIQQKDAFIPPYFDTSYAFRQALEQTRRWVVIGYSFADETIRAMFARASNSSARLVLVHPDNDPATIIKNEPGWSGEVRTVQTKFGEESANTQIAQALR